jgi:hypothetical protein
VGIGVSVGGASVGVSVGGGGVSVGGASVGVADGVGGSSVGVLVGVAVGVSPVGVRVGVAVGVSVNVGSGVDVSVGIPVIVGVGVSVGVGVGVAKSVGVNVGNGVGVRVDVGGTTMAGGKKMRCPATILSSTIQLARRIASTVVPYRCARLYRVSPRLTSTSIHHTGGPQRGNAGVGVANASGGK